MRPSADPSTGAIPRDPRLRSRSTEVCTAKHAGTAGLTSEPPVAERPLQPFGHHFTPTTFVPRDEYDPPIGSCHNCWSPYHRRGDCPHPTGIFCKNCGRKDVDIFRCPRCGPEYVEWKAKDKERRRVKNRLIRCGQWERDTSIRRGTHQPPHVSSTIDVGVTMGQRRIHRMAEITSPTQVPRTSPLAPPVDHVPATSRPEYTEAGPSASRPAEGSLLRSQGPRSDESAFSQRLQEMMRTIAHLSPEVQSRIIARMMDEEERKSNTTRP